VTLEFLVLAHYSSDTSMPTQPLGISRPSGEAAPAAGAEGVIVPNEHKTGEIEQIMPEVYEELRRLAAAYLRGERAEHTLQRTALVHEAYLRLRDQHKLEWQNPAHFIGIFARIMRETLTNYAVAKKRLKRGGEERLQLTLEFYESRKIDVKALDGALRELEALDHRQAQIVELRFFGGLTIEEIAEVLAISPATVKRDWTVAKIWLRRELSSGA
jgi:RNA polymerase sigma-70 factor (ECF subfamily)